MKTKSFWFLFVRIRVNSCRFVILCFHIFAIVANEAFAASTAALAACI